MMNIWIYNQLILSDWLMMIREGKKKNNIHKSEKRSEKVFFFGFFPRFNVNLCIKWDHWEYRRDEMGKEDQFDFASGVDYVEK